MQRSGLERQIAADKVCGVDRSGEHGGTKEQAYQQDQGNDEDGSIFGAVQSGSH
jgi:hypothetical protein